MFRDKLVALLGDPMVAATKFEFKRCAEQQRIETRCSIIKGLFIQGLVLRSREACCGEGQGGKSDVREKLRAEPLVSWRERRFRTLGVDQRLAVTKRVENSNLFSARSSEFIHLFFWFRLSCISLLVELLSKSRCEFHGLM